MNLLAAHISLADVTGNGYSPVTASEMGSYRAVYPCCVWSRGLVYRSGHSLAGHFQSQWYMDTQTITGSPAAV